MSLITSTTGSTNDRKSVNSISANARIDYILRFSQHPVLVIDDDYEHCSQVGNQFLGSLTNEHNAAYISLSSKLNDIQIRCRIIEQLFGNVLFDPEQLLSVNIIKLSEHNSDVITVVIGNAEHLSLQLFHELCQLSETAKKLSRIINVVFLGTIGAAKLIVENNSLFEKKISIIQATTGQLVSFNSHLFKTNSPIISQTTTKVVILVVAVIATIAFLLLSSLWNDSEDSPANVIEDTENKTTQDQFIVIEPVVDDVETPIVSLKNSNEMASTNEIFHLLMQSKKSYVDEPLTNNAIIKVDKTIIPVTKPIESFAELSEVEDIKINTPEAELSNKFTTKIKEEDTVLSKSPLFVLDESYYQSQQSGVVIQFASFENIQGYNTFINNYRNYKLKGYARILNGIKSYIVVSDVFQSSSEAKDEINNLSPELKARGPWVKSIQAIKNEIKLYQQTQ